MPRNRDRFERELRFRITRRDLINGVLAGAGVSLLGPARPAAPRAAEWTGYGGVGDYASSNGNTAEVVEAAHRIRDAAHASYPEIVPHEPLYDAVIVGAGLSGLHAAWEIQRSESDRRSCLLLDNHSVFGGEAKQNELLVDGHRLHGPQGSNDFLVPTEGYTREVWQELGLPERFEFEPPPPGSPPVPLESFGPMFWQASRYPVGHFFSGGPDAPGRWVIDAWRDGFARAPLPARLRRDLAKLWNLNTPPYPDGDFTRWLDSMTYRTFLVDVLRLDPRVTQFVDPLLAAADYGFGSDVISAYAAYYSWLPGVRAYLPSEHLEALDAPDLMSFPGGNSAIARALVRSLLPAALQGPATFERLLNAPIRFDELDRAGAPVRIRLGATVVSVAHEGAPAEAPAVSILYEHRGELRRVRAKSVIMASGAWVNRRVLRDPPEELRVALAQFHHGPMLVVNVALRRWRFLDRLGFAAARWFDGFGFFASIRRPMRAGGKAAPLHPDKPVVLTFYVPLHKPGHDIRTQGTLARQELFVTSYRDYELRIREQMTRLFGAAGFDSARDIAGIILNRWGHAYIAPQPGFLLGTGSAPSPLEVVRRGYGRITFGHSENAGAQNWPNAATEGARAARQALSLL